jgi:hypothetical protein
MQKRSAKTIQRARSLVRLKRKEILHRLGFPESNSIVRIFERIDPNSLDVPIFLTLRSVLDDPANRKTLSHMHEINASTIHLLDSPEVKPLYSHSFLLGISDKKQNKYGRQKYRYLLRDSHAMWIELRPGRRFPVIQSADELSSIHYELFNEYNARHPESSGLRPSNEPFPPPPVPGDENIIPILSAEALAEEGRAQRNCVGSYWWRVVSGQEYIYRVVSENDRATLSLEQTEDGDWRIGQLLAAGNRPVRRETWELVVDWMKCAKDSGQDLETAAYGQQ